MFRFSLRLRAEPAWMRFFYNEKVTELDYKRMFKDLSEPQKVIALMSESSNSNYSDMTSSQMMRAASIFKYIKKSTIKRFRDRTFLSNFLDKLQFRVEEEKSIEWTPGEIKDWCNFVHYNYIIYEEKFKASTMEEILDIALTKLEGFDPVSLAGTTSRVAKYPSHYQVLFRSLMQKIPAIESFSSYSEDQFQELITGILLKKDSFNEDLPRLETEFDSQALRKLVNEIKLRMGKGFSNASTYALIAQCFTKIEGNCQNEVLDLLAERILQLLDIEKKSIEIGFSDLHPYDMLMIAHNFGTEHARSKEIFLAFTKKFFLTHITRQSSTYMSINPITRFSLLNYYLKLSAKHQIFQLVFLDLSVASISEILDTVKIKIQLSQLSSIMESLASLNYASRFNTTMPHKESQWELWQNLLKRSEEIFVSGSEKEEDLDEDFSSPDPSYFNDYYIIKFLWSFCVFDHYSRPVLQTAMSLKKESSLDEFTCKQLHQVHIWLNKEYSAEFKLDPSLTNAMDEAKQEFEEKREPSKDQSELRKAILKTLEESGSSFTEEYREFPYVLDFAQVAREKYAILVDDDSKYLEGSHGLIKSGFDRTMHRQLLHTGWIVKKFSLKSWLKSGHMKLFPN